jgi:hypothetical protein
LTHLPIGMVKIAFSHSLTLRFSTLSDTYRKMLMNVTTHGCSD